MNKYKCVWDGTVNTTTTTIDSSVRNIFGSNSNSNSSSSPNYNSTSTTSSSSTSSANTNTGTTAPVTTKSSTLTTTISTSSTNPISSSTSNTTNTFVARSSADCQAYNPKIPFFDGTKCIACYLPQYWDIDSNRCLYCPTD